MWLCPFILLPRCDTAADVPLRLVFVKDLFDLQIKRAVEKRQTILQVLMYCRLTHAEFARGSTHRRAVFYDVNGEITRPLLDIAFDFATLPVFGSAGVYAQSMVWYEWLAPPRRERLQRFVLFIDKINKKKYRFCTCC